MAKHNNSLREELKRIFKGYKHLTNKISRQLNHLGFKIEIGKTHIKIYYKDNNSKYVTFSKTASDWRTGLNLCTQLNALTHEAV